METFPTLSIHQFDADGIEQAFYINRFSEHLRLHHTNILHPHKHDFYLTVLFTEGTGFHEIDFRRYNVYPGAVFFLHPGQTHHWEFDDQVEGYILFHSEAFFQLHYPRLLLSDYPFFFSRRNVPMMKLMGEELSVFSELPKALLAEYQSGEQFRYRKIAALLECFYIDLSRKYALQHQHLLGDEHRYASRFLRFEQLVEAHFRSGNPIGFYAEQLHLTTRHLNRICQETTGKSPVEILLERILLEARRRMIESELSLNEIALELGYSEYAYFSRVFRQHFHESPRDFRRRYR